MKIYNSEREYFWTEGFNHKDIIVISNVVRLYSSYIVTYQVVNTSHKTNRGGNTVLSPKAFLCTCESLDNAVLICNSIKLQSQAETT